MVGPPKTRPRLFLIDGYALIYRAFFALIQRPLTTSRGENTSAAYGFTNFLLKILKEHEPDYLGVVLDAGSSQREALFPQYKATRQKMPDELAWSIPRIRRILEGFCVPVIELADHEADDVIGTLATAAAAKGLETIIVSGDKDFYQLIRPGICLLNPGRGGSAGIEEEWIDGRNAGARLGVPPERVADYLALIGDSSDNIPGAAGIGPKTAIQLIEQYGPVESILAHAAELPGKRAREALTSQAAAVRLSKELVTIRTDLPVALDLEQLRIRPPQREVLREVFLDLEFQALARDYGAAEENRVAVTGAYHRMQNAAGIQALVAAARQAGQLSLSVQSSHTEPLRARVVGIGLVVQPGTGWYLPIAHDRPLLLELEGSASEVDGDLANLPSLGSDAMRPLAELLSDPAVRKIGHDLKHSLLVLRREGIALRGLAFDTMVASYVLDPGRRDHGIDSLALQFLDHRTTTREDLCGKGKAEVPLAACPPDRVADFACEQADVALRLSGLFVDELDRSGLESLFRDIEVPLISVLAEMEWTGIRIDTAFFASLGRKLERDLKLIQEEIFKIAGGEFNINSMPQLREILFDRLGLPVLKRTKTGASTDVTVLEELAAQGHTLPRLLIDYRQLDKLKGTYVDALPGLINPDTGRIHTSFNQAVAATGRLSSSQPNLQNIPIRTEVGAEIRKGFVPDAGSVFLTADYSQIELRILAHLSGDPAFLEAFREGRDIHRQTAAVMFGVGLDEVTAVMRAAAKTVNFATIYGVGPFALAQRLNTSVAEARSFIEQYFTRFPRVRAYLDEQIAKARELGYVETLSGRRRYIPEIQSPNWNMRQFGERAATNAPVQGSAADIIKLAMIRIDHLLREAGHRSRMLLQVHDELVFEVPREELDEVRALVQQHMETAFELAVPLEAVTGVGQNWFDCK